MNKEFQSLSTLSTRDQQQFKNIVQLYDQRIYKRAIKLTETMLKKYPKQSDLLSMKAFILGALHPDFNDLKHKEAYECAKTAIKLNMKSSMSWHCLGTLYRNDHDYNEAIKCFKTALKFDKEDLVVLRDLATCFIQVRNYQGFREIRNEMKRIRPDIRANWIASALSNHLCGYINSAINCLIFMDKIGNSENYLIEKNRINNEYGRLFSFLDPFQRSEMLLYFIRILLDGKKYQKAYDFMKVNKDLILDKTDYYTILGNLLLKSNLNYSEECSECFNELLKLYPDDDFALFGCMLTDKSLKNIVLPPKKQTIKLNISSYKEEDHSVELDENKVNVIPICGITSQFYHIRGTSGIMYYPLFNNEDIGRNEYLNDKKLSSTNSDYSYGYKIPRNNDNNVLELIVYDSNELEEKKEKYLNSINKLEEFFRLKKSLYPNSDAILRIEMVIFQEEVFISRFKEYINKLNNRITSITSLIAYICKFNKNKKLAIDYELKTIIEESQNLYKKGQIEKGRLIMLYNIYSQHLDCMGLPLEGLNYIEKSLKLDNNKPDTYNIKRKLLKHLYRFEEATESIEEARKIDFNDKYLNTKAACCYLESGNFQKAKDLLKVLITRIEQSKTKNNEINSNETEIKNLQIIWFEKRMAIYSEMYGENEIEILDHYLRIMESMEIMKNDQYDYHLYCLRKMTLNRYLDFINMQDKLYCNNYYRNISVLLWKRLWIIIKKKINNVMVLSNTTKQEHKEKKKIENKTENISQTLELLNDQTKCWNKCQEIIHNYRKDCLFYIPSYMSIYIHYYCSYKLLKNLPFQTCLLVCSQCLYRVFILENSHLKENQLGILPLLLLHFSTKLIKELKPDTPSKEYDQIICQSILKQFETITNLKSQCISKLYTNVSTYIKNINIDLIKDTQSLKNIIKLSIIDSSFEKIESFIQRKIDLNKFAGIFNQEVVTITQLLIIKSLNLKDLESVSLENEFMNKYYSTQKSDLLSYILTSYDISTRKFIDIKNSSSKDYILISDVAHIRKLIQKNIEDISNLPILALNL